MSIRLPDTNYKLYFTIVLLAVLLPASVGYMYTEGSSSEVTRLEIEGAPAGIVFIADPHLRASNINHTREIIRQINDLHPSVVLIGGDFSYEDGEDLSLQEVWSGLEAPAYAVLGNHDYMSGNSAASGLRKMIGVQNAPMEPGNYNTSCLRDTSADYEYADRLAAVLTANGVRVLRNEYEEITIDGRSVVIVGVDDGWAGMADPPEVPRTGSFVIYMIHEPECRTDWDADLILAGHTHGGQFIPSGFERVISGGLVTLSGKIMEGDTVTYITRGTGTSNLDVELRFLSPPEIVYITPPQNGGTDNTALMG